MIYAGNGKDGGRISGRIVDSDMHDVGRFLNRLLGLPPDIQNRPVFFLGLILKTFYLCLCLQINTWICNFRLFELFTSILDLLVHNARSEGQFDSGIVDITANIIEMQQEPKVLHGNHFVWLWLNADDPLNMPLLQFTFYTSVLNAKFCMYYKYRELFLSFSYQGTSRGFSHPGGFQYILAFIFCVFNGLIY